MGISLDDLGLWEGVRRSLEEAGIHTVEELAERRPAELLVLRGLGRTTVAHIHEILADYGLGLKRPLPRPKQGGKEDPGWWKRGSGRKL